MIAFKPDFCSLCCTVQQAWAIIYKHTCQLTPLILLSCCANEEESVRFCTSFSPCASFYFCDRNSIWTMCFHACCCPNACSQQLLWFRQRQISTSHSLWVPPLHLSPVYVEICSVGYTQSRVFNEKVNLFPIFKLRLWGMKDLAVCCEVLNRLLASVKGWREQEMFESCRKSEELGSTLLHREGILPRSLPG